VYDLRVLRCLDVHATSCYGGYLIIYLFICVVVNSVCSDFKSARLLLSHYGFLNLEGLKVDSFNPSFILFVSLNALVWNNEQF